MDGIKRKIDPGGPVDLNVYHLSKTECEKHDIKVLPSSLKEALEEWHSDDTCMKALGKENMEKFLDLKTQ